VRLYGLSASAGGHGEAGTVPHTGRKRSIIFGNPEKVPLCTLIHTQFCDSQLSCEKSRLGHRTARATGIYAKIDLSALREVADFDLGDLE